MTNDTTIPPCPDPTRWTFTIHKADRRTKTGYRLVEEFDRSFSCEEEALKWAMDMEADADEGYTVQYRKHWVLKHGFLSPHKPFWEKWNTPHACSAASETYWSS